MENSTRGKHFFVKISGRSIKYRLLWLIGQVIMLLVLLLYVPSQQLRPWRDGQFTLPHFFLGKLEQAVNQYFVHILSLVTDTNPS